MNERTESIVEMFERLAADIPAEAWEGVRTVEQERDAAIARAEKAEAELEDSVPKDLAKGLLGERDALRDALRWALDLLQKHPPPTEVLSGNLAQLLDARALLPESETSE